MRRPIVIAVSIAALGAAGFGLAFAQSAGTVPPQQISQVTCGNLKGLSSAYRTALVYFAAGYQQGAFDARTGVESSMPQPSASSIEAPSAAPLGNASASTELGAVTVTDPSMSRMEASAASSASAALNATGPSSEEPIVGGLQLDAQAVLDACAKTPDAQLSDVIAANGGTPGGTAVTTTTNTGVGTGNIATSTQPSSAAASAPSGEVSNDLNIVSQQLDNSVVSNQIEASAPPAPGTVTPGTTTTSP